MNSEDKEIHACPLCGQMTFPGMEKGVQPEVCGDCLDKKQRKV